MGNAQYTFGRTADTMLEPIAKPAAQSIDSAVLSSPREETAPPAAHAENSGAFAATPAVGNAFESLPNPLRNGDGLGIL